MRFGFTKKPKFYVPFLGILILAMVVFAVIRNMNEPAVGSISQTPTIDAVKADPYAQAGSYEGRYISFNYPPHYKSVPTKLTGTTLETIQYHATDSTGKDINVAVFRGAADSDSGVTYRRQHPELYVQSSTQKWLEFTKKDGTEDIFFITHGSLLATVASTSPYNNQSSDALFVASSLKWR